MTDKCQNKDHHSHSKAIHQHDSSHGHHEAHAHNTWKADDYEKVLTEWK